MNARAPLPPTALQTYLGRYAAVVASLRLTVYLLAILATGFALAVVVLSYALTKKQLTSYLARCERAGVGRLDRTSIPLDMLGIDPEPIRAASAAAR